MLLQFIELANVQELVAADAAPLLIIHRPFVADLFGDEGGEIDVRGRREQRFPVIHHLFVVDGDLIVARSPVVNDAFLEKGVLQEAEDVVAEFRHYVLSFLEDALFEKCIIYDGGARRYEIPAHYAEVMEYWESLLAKAPQVDFPAFIAEKIGYSRPISYDAWRALNGYSELDVRKLFDLEQHYLDILSTRTLQEICERHIREIRADLGKYVQ